MTQFCPQAVIFDMDGLLVDSEPVWMLAESAMLEARGKVWTAEIQHKLVGLRMDDFLTGMTREYGLTEPLHIMRAEILKSMVSLIPEKAIARPGAPELLAYLQAHNVPCAIASSSAVAIIDAVVTSREWGAYFKIHCSGDEVANGKPAPDVYLEAARRLGVDSSVCLALEDSRNGARAAVAAGMVCYVVPDLSHTTRDAFADVTPYVFDSLHDVQRTLEGCFG